MNKNTAILTGYEILEELGKGLLIEPFAYENLSNNSYDLTLSPIVWEQIGSLGDISDLEIVRNDSFEKKCIPQEGIMLNPNILYIGKTNEYTESRKYVPKIFGRSFVARNGVSVCLDSNAGDLGYAGHWTLEIINHTRYPVRLFPNIRICRIEFFTTKGNVSTIYNTKYMNTDTNII